MNLSPRQGIALQWKLAVVAILAVGCVVATASAAAVIPKFV